MMATPVNSIVSIDSATLRQIETDAVSFARAAGGLLRKRFRTALEVEYKSRGNRDPVSIADKESEEFLTSAIHAAYPSHCVLGEEGNDLEGTDQDMLWVLDPLDGTVNFLNGLPFFAVSIGVLHRGAPVAAAIYVPASPLVEEGVFHTRMGSPSYLEDDPITVTPNPRPEASQLSSLPAMFWRQMAFQGELRNGLGEVRALGSIAVEAALTAAGSMQYAVFNGPKIWDVAAAVLLVKNAGGLTLTRSSSGQPWLPLERFEPHSPAKDVLDGFRRWSQTIVVANPELAWSVAESMRRPATMIRPIQAVLKLARQLPLLH